MGTARTRPHKPDPRHQTLYVADDYRELVRTERVLVGGSSAEALGGLAAVVLGVLGASGYLPVYMAGAATVAIGIALLAQGGSVVARWADTQRRLEGARFDREELIGGVGTEIFGGLAGIVLGALALVGVMPLVLLPVAAIVLGASLLLGGASQPELVELAPRNKRRKAAREAVQASGGAMVLVGIAAVVLGILGLLGTGPVLLLALVAMLSIGGALVVAGGTLTAWLARWIVRP